MPKGLNDMTEGPGDMIERPGDMIDGPGDMIEGPTNIAMNANKVSNPMFFGVKEFIYYGIICDLFADNCNHTHIILVHSVLFVIYS